MPFDIGGFVYNTAFIQDYTKGGIVTDGLILHLDAAYGNSYPKGGTTWYDLSGNSNNGTLTNGPTYNSGNGGSIVFDGTDDYVISTNNTGISGASSRSLCVFCYPTSIPTYTSVAKIGTGNTGQLFEILLFNNDIVGHFWGSGFALSVSSGKVLLDNYSYIVLTYDGTTAYIYVDGSLKGSSNFSLNTTNSQLALGLKTFSSHVNFEGREFIAQLYNRALSSTEITQNYNALKDRFPKSITFPTSNLVFHIDAGDPQSYSGAGTVWYDIQRNYNVSLINGPSYSSSSGGYITFDGSNDYGNLSSEPNLGRVFTINTVLRLFNSVSVEIIYAPTSADRDHWFEVRQNKVSIRLVQTADAPGFIVTGTTTMSTNRTQFYMLTAVVSNNTARVYLNGIQENSGTAGYNFATWNNENGWSSAIARRANLSQYYLGADIGAMTMYTRALSNDEIYQLYLSYKDRYNLL
jgi:hypothetical protein